MPPSTHNTRYADQVSFGFLLWMVFFAILMSTGGITYALLKNHQVEVRTEINNLHNEISVCTLNTNQHRAKTNALTNRWAMRDRLSQDRSQLRDIDRSQIEIARRLQDSGFAVITR
jgi:hypothetical protein